MVDPDDPGWSTVRLRQIRFVPFEIGTDISDGLMNKIRQTMSENNYGEYHLDKCPNLLPEGVGAYTISKRHQLFIFKKGICVSVLTDDYQYSDNLFSIDCCLERWGAHRGILELDENVKENYLKDGGEIRKIRNLLIDLANKFIKDIETSKRGWKKALTRQKKSCDEQVGSMDKKLSYVMTMHVITPAGSAQFGNLDWGDIPEQMRRNIKVLLDPAIINMEETRDFDSKNVEGKKKLFAKIKIDKEENDYEERENLAMYMSWSSVVVLGMPTENDKENDIEEYKILEVMLQSDWYLIHCREKALPETIDDAKKREFTSAGMMMNQYDLDRYLEETTYHSGSTLPARFYEIQKGLLSTSRLTEKTDRYRRMVKDVSDSLMYDDQLRQSKYGRISGILLLIIAALNASSIIYALTNKTYGLAVGAILIIIAVVGAYAIWKKG